ncbi:thiolase family protein [Propionispora hippei]|uniref:Acetoacetyl-CoA thiolase n=1 Tax=Propionispora hippei DSM 15287 TaxID=1123003 RepID=A0A1M6IKP0_9FIRM|nr:thiolase family protein [Propionispora hippei]SHJ34984.1 acetyl-CoA C-acetyltransferase [Propionispora hippei DSM 15287]
MNTVYLIGGCRTPIGKTGGRLKQFLPEKLAAAVLHNTLAAYHLLPATINQVILGNAVGPGGNIARVSVLEAGWPYAIPALTVDAQCGSGLSAIHLACSQIRAGEADLILAGGLESTSLAPKRQFHPADPRFTGPDTFYEQAPFSPPAVGNPSVGEAAENLAEQLNISREAMDRWAWESHQKAVSAQSKGLLTDIIVPVSQNAQPIRDDECIRPALTPLLLSRMPAAFRPGGRITAGNTCLKHDGAAVILLASDQAVRNYRLKPQAILAAHATCGYDPNLFPLSPVAAIEKLLAFSGLPLKAIDSVEINEAFAVKILACCQALDLPPEKVNRLGGALAYGHPYGASGAIILLHLVKALQQTQGRYGIAAIGAVGGLGTATLLERC